VSSHRRCLAGAIATAAMLVLPAGANAAPGWVPATNFALPGSDVVEGSPTVMDEIAYQDGGIVNEAFLQVVSTPSLHTAVHVGVRPPGGTYADQLVIPSGENGIPAGVALAVAPNGAAVVAWPELTGANLETSPFRYRAAYRPAGSATWEEPFTIATDTARNKELAPPALVAVIGANGTAAIGVKHVASGEEGAGKSEPLYRMDVAVHPAAGAWVAAFRLTPPKVSAETLSLSIDSEGDLTAAYPLRFSEGSTSKTEDDRYQAIVRRRPVSSGVWGPEEEITNKEYSHSVLALHLGEDESGDAVLTYTYGVVGVSFNTWAVTRQGPNRPWTSPAQIVTTAESAPLAAAVAPNGTAYVLYHYNGSSSSEECEGVVRAQVELPFTPARCLSPTEQQALSGSIAFIGDDAYFAMHTNVAGEAGNTTMLGARWSNSNGSPDVASNLDPPGTLYGSPTLVPDRDGSVVAFYTNNQPGVLRAAAYDAGPPNLLSASVPATATAGQAVPFAASFFDLWSALGTAQPVWSFGDGSAPVSGASVTHTYAAPGTYTVTLGAADVLGNTASSTHTIVVSAAAAGVPVIKGAHETASRWREGAKGPRISRRKKRPPLGTTFSFSLSEQASVTFTFTRGEAGRKVGGRCVAKNHRNVAHKRCTRTRSVGALTFNAHSGINKVVFQGRITPSKKLGPGSYSLEIVATNAAGQRSRPATLRFTIVR